MITSRQEWITVIECISVASVAIPLLVIFEVKRTNIAWIPTNTPPDWRFSTRNSSWTSDSHGYKWLTTVFEPSTQLANHTQQRLLIMDRHSSYIMANVIAYCMQHAIDLLILLLHMLHMLHMLQLLNVSIFSPLKRALATETDAASQLNPGRISHAE